MRYIIYLLFFCFLYFGVSAQSGVPSQTINGWIKNTYTVPDSGTVVSRRDTSWVPTKFGMTVTWSRPGVDTTQWFWVGNHWIQDGVGTTVDTTSLSNRINLKLNITDTTAMLLPYLRKSDTTNKWIQNVYSRNDSLFKQKNGTEAFIHEFNTSGSGTVTSVGLSMPSAFTVINSPVTGAGTLSVTGAGTTLQYIRGNGTLATLDTGAISNFYLKVRGLLSGTSPITYSTTTGSIGINNATASGTKGAATFTNSDFSDNGSGLISLSTIGASGSCTGCNLTIDAKGRVTAYVSGSGAGATLQTVTDNGDSTTNSVFIKKDSTISTKIAYWFGDSFTTAYGLDSVNEAFPYLVSSRLGFTVRNKGVSSSTLEKRVPVDPFGTTNMVDRISQIPYKGDSIRGLVFFYGLNDVRQNTTNYNPTNFKTDYQQILDSCLARGYLGSDIILGAPWYTTNKAYYNDSVTFGWTSQVTQARSLLFRDKVIELSNEYGTIFVDGYYVPYNNGRDLLYQYDSLHINFQGHIAVANGILEKANRIQRDSQSLAVGGITEVDSVKFKGPAFGDAGFMPLVVNDSGYIATTANGLIYNIATLNNGVNTRVQGGNIAVSGKVIGGGGNWLGEPEDILAQHGFAGLKFTGDIHGNKTTNVVRFRRNDEDYITFSGDHAVTLTNLASATGTYSIAGGYFASASGAHTIALGAFANASGGNSIALQGGSASGQFSFASQGGSASGQYAFSHGQFNRSSGNGSFTIGATDTTLGTYSSAMGSFLRSESFAQFTIGLNNIKRAANSTTGYNANDIAFVVGIGRDTSTSNRRDGFVVKKSGLSYFDSSSYYNNNKVPITLLAADSNHIIALKHFNKLFTDSITARGFSTLSFTNGLTNSSGTVSLGGALVGLTEITGNNTLSFGNGGSPLASLNITSNGRLSIFSGITYDVDANNTDANYTVAANTIIAEITDVLTTGRTLTLPTASVNGQSVTLLMRYSAGSNKYSLSAAVTDNATGSTFTTLDWGKTYDFMVDQSLAWRLIRKY